MDKQKILAELSLTLSQTAENLNNYAPVAFVIGLIYEISGQNVVHFRACGNDQSMQVVEHHLSDARARHGLNLLLLNTPNGTCH